MNADLLLQYFDRISEAPDAISRLRRFILDLAVRGKLVEQDPQDEPASKLLKRIQAEKTRLVKAGELKKKAIEPVGSPEAPFCLPSSWIWGCLGDIAQYGLPDKANSNKDISDDIWVLDLEDIEKDTSRLIERISSSVRSFRSTKTMFKRGDVLFGKLRPYLNKVLVADQDGVCTTEIIPIRGYCGMMSEYVKLVLKSPLTMEKVDRLMYGMKMPRLGTGDAVLLNFPLPPLAEQQRIVAKVDELMALCDQLEAARNEREARRQRLTASSLQRLNQPADAASLRADARFHLDNLTRLTTRPEQIKQLRQTILNLAVRGCLCSHELAGQIESKKTNSFTVNRSDFGSSVFTDAVAMMILPSHWSVAPLDRVASEIVDCPHSTPKWTGSGKICVRTNQFRPGFLDLAESRYVSDETFVERIQRLRPAHNDILYSREGGILGIACRVPADIEICLGQRMMLVRTGKAMLPVFLELVLNSPLITEIAQRKTTGGAAPRVNVATVRAFPIPIPPLAEQHRIVARVDELMALCDQLENQLTTTATESRRLLEAVLRDAIKPQAQA